MSSQNIFDEQQAMMMALDMSGNHVMCLDLQQNRVFDLVGKATFGTNVGLEVCYTYIHPDDCERFRTFIERLSNGTDQEAECRYRWNQNYTGQGGPEWHDLYNHSIAEYADGKPVSIIATITDETETKRKEREVEQLSTYPNAHIIRIIKRITIGVIIETGIGIMFSFHDDDKIVDN